MQVFENNGKRMIVAPLVPAKPGTQDHEQGPEPFPPAEKNMLGHFRHQVEIRLQILKKGLFDFFEIPCGRVQNSIF